MTSLSPEVGWPVAPQTTSDAEPATAATVNDPVARPAHYTDHPSGVECIDVVQHYPFCVGAAIKYLWRAGRKGDAVQDLLKARRMIDYEIARLEAR